MANVPIMKTRGVKIVLKEYPKSRVYEVSFSRKIIVNRTKNCLCSFAVGVYWLHSGY